MYRQLYTASTLKVYPLKKSLPSFDEMLSNWNSLLLLKNAMEPIICQVDLLSEGEVLLPCLYYCWLPEPMCPPRLTWWLSSPPVPPILFFSVAEMVPGRLSDYSESSCLHCGLLQSLWNTFYLRMNGTWGRGLDQDWQKQSSSIRGILMT